MRNGCAARILRKRPIMRFALLWILRTCCLFTMTVKGTWPDVPARPHFLIITFLERVYIYPHLWYDNARNLGFREVTSCPNTSLQSTSLLCRTPSNLKAAANARLPVSLHARPAALSATCSVRNRKKLKKRKERPCSRSYGREFFNCCREIFLLGAQKNSWIIM